jgi:hypothetical protein
VKIPLANPEPSTHGTLSEVWRFGADGFVLAFAAPNRIGRASLYHKARLIQINAALIRRVNFHAGGCEEFMKVHAIQAGSDRGPRACLRRSLQPFFSGVSRKPIRLIWRNAPSA